MKIHHALDHAATERPRVLAIGFFDGFHLGHQAIVRATLRMRRPGFGAAVLTFANHPAAFLRPGSEPPLIATLEERVNAIARAGIDEAFVLPFDNTIAQLSPKDFIERILIGTLHIRGLVVGENFRFGHKRAGDGAFARAALGAHGVPFEALPNEHALGARVSSTRIRQALADGDLTVANALLGEGGYTLRGQVVLGEGRGHDFGVPTANLAIPPGKTLPKDGVYAASARHDGREYAALVSIGTKPTFEARQRTVEVWLRDFQRTIYSEQLALRELRFLRDQAAFESIEALIEQMRLDMEAVQFPTLA